MRAIKTINCYLISHRFGSTWVDRQILSDLTKMWNLQACFFCNASAYLPLRKRKQKYSVGHVVQSRRQHGSDDQCRSTQCRHVLCPLAPTVPSPTTCRIEGDSQTTVLSIVPSARRSPHCTVWSVPPDRRTDRSTPSLDSFYLHTRQLSSF